MYCKNCGKEIADDSKFCQHCGASLVTEAPVVNEETPQVVEQQKGVSQGKGITILFGSLAAIIVLVVLYCMFLNPLDNDKACHDSGVDAHEAFMKLRTYQGGFEEKCPMSETCPVCSPWTWRWNIRKNRQY